MGPVVEVDDPDDPRLADYRSLTDVALRTRIEPPHGLFIAEGALVIERAVAAGYELRSVLLSPHWLDRSAASLLGSTAPVYVGSSTLLESLTGFHVHRGALAAVHRRPLPTVDEVAGSARRLVVFEAAVNHTNLGAVFRSAAGLGMDGVILSPDCADPLYRRSVRVSMGTVFTVPYARALRWPDALADLRQQGFTVAALTPSPDAMSLADLDVGPHRRLALVLGTEGPGLTPAAIEASDTAVTIPMSGRVDSLNVAAAAAVAFWVAGHNSG